MQWRYRIPRVWQWLTALFSNVLALSSREQLRGRTTRPFSIWTLETRTVYSCHRRSNVWQRTSFIRAKRKKTLLNLSEYCSRTRYTTCGQRHILGRIAVRRPRSCRKSTWPNRAVHQPTRRQLARTRESAKSSEHFSPVAYPEFHLEHINLTKF